MMRTLEEQWHADVSGDRWRTRFDGRASDGGHFGIVPPHSSTSDVLLDGTRARELRDRLNEYLGESNAG